MRKILDSIDTDAAALYAIGVLFVWGFVVEPATVVYMLLGAIGGAAITVASLPIKRRLAVRKLEKTFSRSK